MRLPKFRVRTLMVAIALGTLLAWGATMGYRSYVYARLAGEYAWSESGWRQTDRGLGTPEFRLRCAEYFARLSGKYRRASWRPWEAVAPDEHAPGYDEWVEQERRARLGAVDGGTPEVPPAQNR